METKHVNQLTEKEYWDGLFKAVKLPRVIDIKTYNYYRFDRLFRSLLGSNLNGAQFLEAGCAASAWLVYFAKEFRCSVTGVDYSEIGCKLAEDNLRLNGVEGKVICEDVFKLEPAKIGKFDIIFSYGIIEHFSDPTKVLQIMKNLLEPDGMLIAIVPNIRGIYGTISKYWHKDVYEKHKVIGENDMRAYLVDAGFNSVQSSWFGTFYLGVIGWSNQPSLPNWFLRFFVPGVHILDRMVSFILRVFKIELESRFFSPYLVGVGRLSGSVER